jgi:hypothetical protein
MTGAVTRPHECSSALESNYMSASASNCESAKQMIPNCESA